jgi:hypothetical protein
MTKVETNRGACGLSVMMALITEFYNKVSEIVVIPPGEPITIWHLFGTCSTPINR